MSEPTPLEKIFFAALEKASGLRAAYLDEVCAGDGKLRHRVELMLSAQAYSASFLESPASVPGLAQIATAVPTNTEVIGSQIGPYKLIEQIGDGGMGVVYMAAQKEPVRRMVALKVIKAGMDTQQVVARFEAERQALAMMDHPNIAKILDAGATDAGRPYFVMELVKGAPFTEFCDRHKLDTKHRLQLFITVCQAVQHAHQKGLIHRDIKPSNIIVGMHDVTPVPKVIDFGVAKAIGQQLTEKTLHSGFHQMVGTPLYMSPEQAGQSSIDIDTRSDIYSLGVLLYEILTGHTPFESETLRNAGYDEMRRMIREVDPPRPSLRVSTLDAKALSTISDNRNVDARKLSHQLRGELDWIVMMALEKDRNRRYDTANEFADDVQRFLNDEAVQACPPSTLYRFRKLASRNRATLSAATLVAAALIIGTAVATWQAMRARDSQAQTEIAKQQIDLRYRIAKEAVDTYLLRVTQDERLDHPSFRQLRQSLLEAALPYYDQLHEISPTDEQSRSARAETLNQLGTVKHELGRFDESLTSFEESAKLFDLLSADNAAKIDYRQSLAKVLVNLADHYRTRGATSESLEYEQHALALRQQLVTEHPDNDLLHLELAQSYTNVGVGTQEMDGREMLERAIEIWQELADRFPDQPLYREYLSLGYQNLANRFAWDQAEQAIPFHELAIGLLEQLAKEQPESKKAHIQWAQSHQSLADTLEKLSPRLSDAREHCEESIRILSAFAKRHPESPEVKSHLANSLTKLAHTLKELDELVMAHETCDSALRLWEQLQSEYPDMLEYEVGMAAAQQNLGAIVVAQGQATEGMSMLTQSRDRLQKLVDRIGPHDRSNELLRTITSSLADTRKVLGEGRERSSEDERPERKIKTAGEALRPSKFLTDLSNSPTHGLRVGGMAPSLTQTEEPEQSMKRLLTKNSRSSTRPQIRNERPLRMEQLEERALMAVDISISDASAIEGSEATKYIDDFVTSASGGLSGPRHLLFGPDANNDGKSDLYVPSRWTNQVLKYDGVTGSYLGVLVQDSRLIAPWAMALGPDGNLYIAGSDSDNVLRYDFTTQAVDEFLAAGTAGMLSPRALMFGGDGNLYVGSSAHRTIAVKDEVLRFQGPLTHVGDPAPGSPLPAPGQTGAIFVPDGAGGVNAIDRGRGLVFGQDATGDGVPELYVTNGGGNSVNRYNGATGAFLNVFVASGSGGLANPEFLTIHGGYLYVSSQNSNQVMRYSATNGTFVDVVVPTVGGLIAPTGLAFDSSNNLYVSFGGSGTESRVVRYGSGSQAVFTVRLSSSTSVPVTLTYSTTDGSANGGSDYQAVTSGTVYFAPGETSKTILIQTIDDTTTEPTETFAVNLSNPVGASIAVGQGIGSILDNDPFTKFYVVSDLSTDRTYEYGATGASVENYPLAGGNTAPRGAASTTLGTKVWVVDANKSVYTYDTSGVLQGSWAAGGLQSTAQLEGIATNGTDVWLVDNKTDKVYRYANAASLTNGSPVATSSFSLNSGNTSPKDIVTDGNYLWVVNDSSTDKVFKYTIGGTYVGSWTISTSGASSPTGITLDPSNPSAIWIVDSGTAKVYQYDNAVGLTSGSKSANSSWALAAGNTNPQGIADPPPPSAGSTIQPASSVSYSAFMQAPIVSLVVPSTERAAQSQSVFAATKSVDEFMSQLASSLPVAPFSVNKVQSMPFQSRTRIAEDQSIDLALADDELSDSLHTIANELFESTLR